jgi:hypothetical protein
MKAVRITVLAALVVTAAIAAQASEIGHFSPGVANIRDYYVPEPGFYGFLYNYWYMSDQLNDRNGDEISQVTVGKSPLTTTVDVSVDLDVYVVIPGAMWVSDWKILGAKYAAYAMFPLSNTSIAASLVTQTGTGRNIEDSQFSLGDCFVQPVWLGWTRAHFDAALGYGFYAPIGKYDTETVTLPVIGDVTAEASDNIGLGFWTHQFQGASAWYPWTDKRMAVAGALTYEIHGNKQDFDLTPGQNLALNWGVSEYLPLTKDQLFVLEVSALGYDSWQLTDDSGDDARNADVRDEAHGVGLQVGSIYTPWKVALNFRYIYEYAATDRFQGQSFGLNLAVGF